MEPEDSLYFLKKDDRSSPTRMLKLTNPTGSNVAFKVKTTAPKSYLVRPSSGTLRPNDSQDVQIILQPSQNDGAANSHRFLVQASKVTSAEPVSREQWASIGKDDIQEHRLSVVLEERASEDVVPASGGITDAKGGDRTSGASETPTDLKVKYDELVQYTLMLEKEKKKIEDEMKTLKDSKGGSGDSGGITKVHLIIVALITFLLSYAAKFMGS